MNRMFEMLEFDTKDLEEAYNWLWNLEIDENNNDDIYYRYVIGNFLEVKALNEYWQNIETVNSWKIKEK